jgi:hypothetical protein
MGNKYLDIASGKVKPVPLPMQVPTPETRGNHRVEMADGSYRYLKAPVEGSIDMSKPLPKQKTFAEMETEARTDIERQLFDMFSLTAATGEVVSTGKSFNSIRFGADFFEKYGTDIAKKSKLMANYLVNDQSDDTLKAIIDELDKAKDAYTKRGESTEDTPMWQKMLEAGGKGHYLAGTENKSKLSTSELDPLNDYLHKLRESYGRLKAITRDANNTKAAKINPDAPDFNQQVDKYLVDLSKNEVNKEFTRRGVESVKFDMRETYDVYKSLMDTGKWGDIPQTQQAQFFSNGIELERIALARNVERQSDKITKMMDVLDNIRKNYEKNPNAQTQAEFDKFKATIDQEVKKLDKLGELNKAFEKKINEKGSIYPEWKAREEEREVIQKAYDKAGLLGKAAMGIERGATEAFYSTGKWLASLGDATMSKALSALDLQGPLASAVGDFERDRRVRELNRSKEWKALMPVIDHDNLGREVTWENFVYTDKQGKKNYSWESVPFLATKTTLEMAPTLAMTAITGGVGGTIARGLNLGTKAAATLESSMAAMGTFTSVYAQVYPHHKMEALEQGLSKDKAESVAMAKAALEAGIEALVLPDYKYIKGNWGNLTPGARDSYRLLFGGFIRDKFGKKLSGEMIDKVLGVADASLKVARKADIAIKAGLKSNLGETAEEVLTDIAHSLVDDVTAKDNVDYINKNKATLDSLWTTAATSFVSMGIMGMHAGNQAIHHQIAVSRFDAARYPELFKAQIKERLDKGLITPKEAARQTNAVLEYNRILEENIETFGKINTESNKPDYESQVAYFNSLIEKDLKIAQAASTIDPAKKDELLKQLDNINATISDIRTRAEEYDLLTPENLEKRRIDVRLRNIDARYDAKQYEVNFDHASLKTLNEEFTHLERLKAAEESEAKPSAVVLDRIEVEKGKISEKIFKTQQSLGNEFFDEQRIGRLDIDGLIDLQTELANSTEYDDITKEVFSNFIDKRIEQLENAAKEPTTKPEEEVYEEEQPTDIINKTPESEELTPDEQAILDTPQDPSEQGPIFIDTEEPVAKTEEPKTEGKYKEEETYTTIDGEAFRIKSVSNGVITAVNLSTKDTEEFDEEAFDSIAFIREAPDFTPSPKAPTSSLERFRIYRDSETSISRDNQLQRILSEMADTQSQGGVTFVGDKLVNGHVSIANMARAYRTVRELVDNKMVERMEDASDVLDPNYFSLILDPKLYQPGTKIKLNVKSIEDSTNIQEHKARFTAINEPHIIPQDINDDDYFREIEILDEDGNVLGNVHTLDYIREARIAVNPEMPNNLRENYKNLKVLRKRLAEAEGLEITTTITGKSHGRISFTMKTNGKHRWFPVTEHTQGNEDIFALNDPNYRSKEGDNFINEKHFNLGSIYKPITLPSGAKFAISLKANKLSTEMVDSFISAIKFYREYVQSGEEARAELDKKYTEFNKKFTINRADYDIRTLDGLNNYLNLITYSNTLTSRIVDNDIANYPFIDFDKKSSRIKFSKSVLDQAPARKFTNSRNVTTFQLDKPTDPTDETKVYEMLKDTLESMGVNVNRNLQTQTRTRFTLPLLKADYSTVEQKYNSYKEFVASNLQTNVLEHQLPNGKVSYAEQPVIQFDPNFTVIRASAPEAKIEAVTSAPATFDADFVFEQNPKLAEIGTPEQYSEYLKTVFPETKLEGIYYHGSPNTFEEFKPSMKYKPETGFHFVSELDFAKTFGDKVYPVLLNVKNLREVPDLGIWSNENFKEEFGMSRKKFLEQYDGLKYVNDHEFSEKNSKVFSGVLTRELWEEIYKVNPRYLAEENIGKEFGSMIYPTGRDYSYAVFNKDQIHMLGSNADIEAFKNFVSSGTTPTVEGPSLDLPLNEDEKKDMMDDFSEFMLGDYEFESEQLNLPLERDEARELEKMKEAERLRFVEQRNEFIKRYNIKLEKPMGRKAFNIIKNSAEMKDKYDMLDLQLDTKGTSYLRINKKVDKSNNNSNFVVIKGDCK